MPLKSLSPYWSDDLTTLYLGDVNSVLRRLRDKSVQCVVTSPPYWGLRDYGVEGQLGAEPSPDCDTKGHAQCGRCFVCSMVGVFRNVRRVLRDDGTCWIVLGDTYSSGGGNGTQGKSGQRSDRRHTQETLPNRTTDTSLPPGNLVGVPWRVALALQADGWVLRQEIIWHKPSPMPESVKTRCTKAHEQVFLLTKQQRYFYDKDAIAEPSKGQRSNVRNGKGRVVPPGAPEHGQLDRWQDDASSNKRSVWTVSSGNGYEGAHFAAFPPALVEPMILAGTSEYGACTGCGSPWRRVVDSEKLLRQRPNEYVKRTGAVGTGNSCGNTVAGVRNTTTGWEPTCGCKFYRLRDDVPAGIIEELKSLGLA
jgi:DNA modification methylase